MGAPLKPREWNGFDLAHARFLLEHLSDPLVVVQQMARAVRSGGRVVLVDDDHGSFRPWPIPPGFEELWLAYVQSFQDNGTDPCIGRRLVSLMYDSGVRSIRNTEIFFGGAGGHRTLVDVSENLIGALIGARDAMVSTGIVDKAGFYKGIDGLRSWQKNPAAALWYSISWAEGVLP